MTRVKFQFNQLNSSLIAIQGHVFGRHRPDGERSSKDVRRRVGRDIERPSVSAQL